MENATISTECRDTTPQVSCTRPSPESSTR